MTRIYLDNAATSWPKPPEVYDAVDRYQRQLGAPAGRSSYREAAEVERAVSDARASLARLLQVDDPRRIIFTFNGTDALNLALAGLLRTGDHVVTTVCEHNSVLRPLRHLADTRNVDVTYVPCDAEGIVSADDVLAAVTPQTRLVAMVHASNVTGALQPVEEVGQRLRGGGALLLVDAAQTLGHLPVLPQQIGADLLAAPGHKGLMGPLGTGLLYIAPGVEGELQSVRQGGTGTRSEDDRQPEGLPDKYEAGNQNVPGIVGLGAAASYLLQRGLDDLRQHDVALCQQLLLGLAAISGVRVLGPMDTSRRVGVVSVQFQGYEPQEVAATLDAAYHVQARAGLHCAPRMHQALLTLDVGGTVRFSLGAFNTAADVDSAIEAAEAIAAASLPI